MTVGSRPVAPAPPDRLQRISALTFVLSLSAAAFVIWSFLVSAPSADKLARGLVRLVSPQGMIARMFPPETDRIPQVFLSLLETFQMAIAGTILGLIIAMPLAVLAAEGLSPHPLLRAASRVLIAVFRTVPDLVWAIVFIITVGLGPAAGVLALMVDTTGFAGRFFAEAMEETDKGPREALSAIGATRAGILFSAVIPQAVPSFIATSLFCLEKSVRGSVVLGLVGAGGIGIELKTAFDLFDYDQALTVIIAIFLLVVAVEQVSARIRSRII